MSLEAQLDCNRCGKRTRQRIDAKLIQLDSFIEPRYCTIEIMFHCRRCGAAKYEEHRIEWWNFERPQYVDVEEYEWN